MYPSLAAWPHSAWRSAPKWCELKRNSHRSKMQFRDQCRPSCPCLLDIPGWNSTEQMWGKRRQDRPEDQEISSCIQREQSPKKKKKKKQKRGGKKKKNNQKKKNKQTKKKKKKPKKKKKKKKKKT